MLQIIICPIAVTSGSISDITSQSGQLNLASGHPFVGRRSEYQPKGDDALRLESEGRYGSFVGGR